ncbi:MAG: ribonuclease [Burkholderiaceae bacterium]
MSGSWRKLGLATVIAASAAFCQPVLARGPVTASDSVPLTELPREAQQTERLIRAGGPFPYAKDGVAFGNRERQLPRRERGYYREYTVPTPGAHNRGARRIVCGGIEVRKPEACYYTDDHYASFRRIVQ